MKKRRKTGGVFNPADQCIVFLAANMDRQKDIVDIHDYVLVAVNELNSPEQLAMVDEWVENGRKVFIDSGIFWLTNEHARKHNVRMDEALSLAPEEIDGFDALWDRYLAILDRFGSRAWGYIELDQGGMHNKKRTRARIEAEGFSPIPVYHPLNDGWDYFDELAQTYDRICFGNIVQAPPFDRKRLIATAWERHRKYPHLWIHLLGYTLSELLYALPINSCDSSSWLSGVRWSDGLRTFAGGKTVGGLPKNFSYKLGSPSDGETGAQKATQLSAYDMAFQQRNWRNHMQRLHGLGFELYPGGKI